MTNYLLLKFNNDHRSEAMALHSQLHGYRIQVVRVSYIAGWVSMDGDIQLTKIDDKVVEFKIANNKYVVSRNWLDDINFEIGG